MTQHMKSQPKQDRKKQDFDCCLKSTETQSSVNKRERSSYFISGKPNMTKITKEMRCFFSFNKIFSEISFSRYFFTFCLTNQIKSQILALPDLQCHENSETVKKAMALTLKSTENVVFDDFGRAHIVTSCNIFFVFIQHYP